MNWLCWNTRWNLRGEQLFVSETVSMFWWICWYLIPSRNAWCRNARLPEFAWISDESTRVLQIQPAGCCAGIIRNLELLHWTGEIGLTRFGPYTRCCPEPEIDRSACGGTGLNNPMQLRINIVHPRQPCSLVPVHAKSQHSRHRKSWHLAQQISEEIHFELDSEYDIQRNQCVWE